MSFQGWWVRGGTKFMRLSSSLRALLRRHPLDIPRMDKTHTAMENGLRHLQLKWTEVRRWWRTMRLGRLRLVDVAILDPKQAARALESICDVRWLVRERWRRARMLAVVATGHDGRLGRRRGAL